MSLVNPCCLFAAAGYVNAGRSPSIFLNPAGEVLANWVLPAVIPIALLSVGVFYLLSRPLRRQEHARFLLELIESALRQGESVEHHIICLSRSKEASLGARFHLLAAFMEQGHGLIRALEKVPRLLPPQVGAMLRTGEALGDVSRILPACRNVLQDGTSQARALMNYQLTFALLVNPIVLIVLLFIYGSINPKFNEIAGYLRVAPPQLFGSFGRILPILAAVQLAAVLFVYACAVFMLGGARFVSWIEAGIVPLSNGTDWLLMRVPWRRKRLQRDFSAMLALLLDAGVPEDRAVSLAASSTANGWFIGRSERVIERLHDGDNLIDAMQWIDDTGEFRWRLTNAARTSGHFFKALNGWHESLDARAFKEEQAAAQVISTILILLNGLTVGLVAVGVYQLISQFSSVVSSHS